MPADQKTTPCRRLYGAAGWVQLGRRRRCRHAHSCGVRISVDRGIWTAEDALLWAESCQDDAWAAAGDCDPAEVAAEDVDVCRKEAAHAE
jgi:hypothetical protein